MPDFEPPISMDVVADGSPADETPRGGWALDVSDAADVGAPAAEAAEQQAIGADAIESQVPSMISGTTGHLATGIIAGVMERQPSSVNKDVANPQAATEGQASGKPDEPTTAAITVRSATLGVLAAALVTATPHPGTVAEGLTKAAGGGKDCYTLPPSKPDGTRKVEKDGCTFTFAEAPGALVSLIGAIELDKNQQGTLELLDGGLIAKIILPTPETVVEVHGEVDLLVEADEGSEAEVKFLTAEEKRELEAKGEISADEVDKPFVLVVARSGTVRVKKNGQDAGTLSNGAGKNFRVSEEVFAADGCTVCVNPKNGGSPAPVDSSAFLLMAGGMFLALRRLSANSTQQ